MDEEELDEFWDDYDWCYECRGLGDDYYFDKDGELVSSCDDCSHRKVSNETESHGNHLSASDHHQMFSDR